MKKLLILLGVAIVVSACEGAGSSGNNPTISASAANCSPITMSNQCIVTLTYNANNNFNLGLGVTYSPQQLAQFTVSSLASCPTPSGSNNQTCLVTVTYLSTGTSISENLIFTLGNASSNNVFISGN